MRKKLLLAITLLSFIGFSSNVVAGPPPKLPPPSVDIEKVNFIETFEAKEYVGNIEAIEEVDLQPRVSGYITQIKFKNGQYVKKGDLLIQIEDTTYKNKVMSAKALLEQANAEFSYADSNHKRKKRLFKKDTVSKATFEDAERLLQRQKAKNDQMKADLLDAENELSYTKITAPIAGRIGKVIQTVGNYVSLSSPPLAKIVAMNPIWVKFSLSEREYQNLFKIYKVQGDHIDINIELANGDKYSEKGKIAFVNNVVDRNTGTIAVWVELKNSDMLLIPGGYVTALVAEKMKTPIPGIKESAVMTDRRGNYVYVLGADNIPVRRDIELGELVGHLYIIKKGLKTGEEVLVGGIHKVMPGKPVTPIRVDHALGKNNLKSSSKKSL